MRNHKISILAFLLIIQILFFRPGLLAQETELTSAESELRQMRLPIPVIKTDSSKYFSLADEIAQIITRIVRELRLSDMIVGIEIDSTIQPGYDIAAKAPVLNLQDLGAYSDAIVIVDAEIFQKGVPPKEDENYFSLHDQVSEENLGDPGKIYSNNIQTRIHLLADLIDIESGEVYQSLDLEITHTGGSLKKSKQKAVKKFEQRILYELKSIYWFSADIVETKNGKLGIPFGTSYQVQQGMMFDIFEPDQIWTVERGDSIVPGGVVGLAVVVDTSADSSGLQILRQWREHYPGSWVIERYDPIFALGMNFYLPTNDSYANLGFSFNLRPLRKFDYGFGMQIIRVVDSYGDDDYGFGFGGFGIWRFFNSSKIDFGGKLGLDLEIPFRKDDDDQTVNTALFSVQVGVVAELLFARKMDFVIQAGYRFTAKSDYWEYSEGDETFPAFWENEAPEVDNSGFSISIGLKYLLF